MKGTITHINPKKGMVAVLTDTEDYSIFEILSDDNFEIGDIIAWDEIHPLGDCVVKNSTNGESLEVYFQNHWIKDKDLGKQLLLS